MKERIRELAEQARVQDRGYFIYQYGDHQSVEKAIDLEKFAELIVRECAKKGFDIFDEEPDAPASDLQFYVRDGIKKHFGVE